MKGTAGAVSVESAKPESNDEDTQSVGKFPDLDSTLQAQNLYFFSFSKSDGDDYDDGDGFFYNPELGELPDFEMLPDILDLPNVAQVKQTGHKTYMKKIKPTELGS